MKRSIILSILAFCWLISGANAAMNDYCVIPISSSTATKPNILILMDYSGSMQFPAYVTCNYDTYDPYDKWCDDDWCKTNNTVVNCYSASGLDKVEDNYNSATTYYGLFDMTKYYQQSSSKFHVNTSCTNTNKIGSGNACISGNLLNWITSSRIDVSRKVLTGGRTSTGASDEYQSEGAKLVYTDTALHCKFTVTTQTTNGEGAARSRQLSIADASGTCPVTTSGSNYDIDVVPLDPSADTGIIQDFYDKAYFEFMIFDTAKQGVLLAAKDPSGNSMSNLIAAIWNEQPYNGTPTGEGLIEAKDYFKQSNDNSYASNTNDLSLGNGVKDPWYDGSGNSSRKIPCRKSFVLLISDGVWNFSVDPASPAKTMRTTDLRSDLTGTQRVTTYAVYAFGDRAPATKLQGRRAMKTVAAFGGFDDYDSSGNPYPFSGLPSDSRTVPWGPDDSEDDETDITGYLAQCDPRTSPPSGHSYNDDKCKEWDKDRSGSPYNFFEADDGDTLKTSIMNAINDMVRRVSSGTAASVLASSEGSGANILQSVYFPTRLFGNTEITWTGAMQNLWYYIDPALDHTSIREDTDQNKVLNLTHDYRLKFIIDSGDNQTKAQRWSTNADGSTEELENEALLENINSIWEAGTLLYLRDASTRTIYTTTDGSSFLSGGFTNSNAGNLQASLGVASSGEAGHIIDFVRGTDYEGYRERKVKISGVSETAREWKLGDIVSSTPKIQSAIPLNGYHRDPPNGYSDSTYLSYISDSNYKSRGMAYVGANDGMLHAFKFGLLQETWSDKDGNDKARLYNDSESTALGTEMWAFIPKNALPYLQYTKDPNYSHVNIMDLPSTIVDTTAPSGSEGDTSETPKTVSSWKTILIGGMGTGGANKNYGDNTCATGANGECVKTPVSNVGYSSYFALNVTDPGNPQLLWEFSDSNLGFSTSGPAIIRIGDPGKQGKWFAVFASGPTGPIDTGNHQFKGGSNQNLKLFVLDLYTGELVKTIDPSVTNAFGGPLYSGVIDVQKPYRSATGTYSDDALYVGYTQYNNGWKGGVLRLMTAGDPDPDNWVCRTLIDGIGPVTSAVTKLQDTKKHQLWLYFGTGRFYFKYGSTLDDPRGKQRLYGVMDPAYQSDDTLDVSYTTPLSVSALDDQTTDPSSALGVGTKGWYIDLDVAKKSDGVEATQDSDVADGAERVITDPLAASTGSVFFMTYVPSADVCSMGGKAYIWAVRYNTATAISSKGTVLSQTSTGAITEKSLQNDFTFKNSRRCAEIVGMPPKGPGISALIPPVPIGKFLHIRQR